MSKEKPSLNIQEKLLPLCLLRWPKNLSEGAMESPFLKALISRLDGEWPGTKLEQVVGNTLNKFIWGQSPEGAAALTGFLQALWAMPSQGGSGGHSGHVGSLPHGPRQGQSLHSSSGPSLVPCHAWVSWLGDLAVPPCPVTRARLRDLVSCLSFPGAVGRWRCGNCVHWGLLLEGWMAMGSLLP